MLFYRNIRGGVKQQLYRGSAGELKAVVTVYGAYHKGECRNGGIADLGGGHLPGKGRRKSSSIK